MEASGGCTKILIVSLLFSFFFTAMITHCDARKSIILREVSPPIDENMKHSKILEMAENLNMLIDVSKSDSTNAESYVTSPITLPPFNSLSPNSLPGNNNSPPYCVYPPPNPQSPSTTTPSPVDYNPTPFPGPPSSPTGSTSSPAAPETSPSPPSTNPGPPQYAPSPPSGDNIPSPPSDDNFPGPPSGGNMPSPSSDGNIPSPSSGGNTLTPPSGDNIPSPPGGNIPSPPSDPSADNPTPPEFVPSPLSFVPSPPVFEPPVVYPPPTTPSTPPTPLTPPPSSGGGGRGSGGVWCVAKPSVPDPIIQEAMNYACGSGADCGPIQPNGPCYQPNTILAHASYAFNSYWQRTKVAGGTCSFGGIAILVTVDPSSGSCQFVSV